MTKKIIFLFLYCVPIVSMQESEGPQKWQYISFQDLALQACVEPRDNDRAKLTFIVQQNQRYQEIWGIIQDLQKAHSEIRITIDSDLKTEKSEIFLFESFEKCTALSIENLLMQINATMNRLAEKDYK